VAMGIVNPVRFLMTDMADVAEMKVQDIDENRPESMWSDIASMEGSFKTMVRNLIAYKAYMPATLFADDDEDGEGDEDIPGAAKRSEVGSKRSSNKTGKTGTAAVTKMVVDKREALSAIGVKKKPISVLILNISDTNEVVLSKASNEFASFIGGYLGAALQAIQGCRGVPDGFSGDHVYASFNAVTNCVTHRQQLCRASFTAKTKGEEALRAEGATGTIRAGGASGSAHIGTLGSDKMKKFSIIGNLYVMANCLQRMSKQYSAPVCVNVGCYQESKDQYLFKALGVIASSKLAERNYNERFLIFQCLKGKDSESEEWMYQMEAGQKGDPYAQFNIAVMAAARGANKEEVMKELTIPQEVKATCDMAMLEQMADQNFPKTVDVATAF